MMEQWHAKNPTAELRWHLLPHPPFGLATSDPGARTQLANSPDADRMLLESDAWFARKTGNASTLYMARTALSLVKQLPHIDQLH